MGNWPTKNSRIVITKGPYTGQAGTAIRSLGRGEWLVKLDSKMFGTTVSINSMAKES